MKKVTIALLVVVSIYCYLIKYQEKQMLVAISRHKYRIKRDYILIILKNNKFKVLDIKNHTYFFDDIINIKCFDPNKFKIDEKSYKKILIYCIGYLTIKNLKRKN